MTLQKQISIIIPTYNMEDYIGNCIESLIIRQFDKVDVIIINDGSKDSSSEIAHRYADLYPDSIRVIDKPNGNYGSCINAALPFATGRYIKILDADDTFNTEAFNTLVDRLSDCTADAIITNLVYIDTHGNETGESDYGIDREEQNILSIDTAYETLLKRCIPMHCITYKRSVFADFSYKQTEGISYTDNQWSTIPLAYCKSVQCIPLTIYRYLLGREGQTMSPQQLKKSMWNMFQMLKDSINYLHNVTDPMIAERIRSHFIEIHDSVYRLVLKHPSGSNMTILKRYDTYLKDFDDSIFRSLDTILYVPEINFKIFRNLRKRGYPTNYEIPFYARVWLSLIIRWRHLIRRN